MRAGTRALAANDIGDMAVVMLIGSIYMSIFVIASTMGTAVTQQHRELALVRAIGARRRQVRRAVVVQAVAAAVPAAPAGFLLGGGLLSRVWFAGERDTGSSRPRWRTASRGSSCPCVWRSPW